MFHKVLKRIHGLEMLPLPEASPILITGRIIATPVEIENGATCKNIGGNEVPMGKAMRHLRPSEPFLHRLQNPGISSVVH
jgi:hypothetical protein